MARFKLLPLREEVSDGNHFIYVSEHLWGLHRTF